MKLSQFASIRLKSPICVGRGIGSKKGKTYVNGYKGHGSEVVKIRRPTNPLLSPHKRGNAMKLNQLTAIRLKSLICVGRGIGSGKGKTYGNGYKGHE